MLPARPCQVINRGQPNLLSFPFSRSRYPRLLASHEAHIFQCYVKQCEQKKRVCSLGIVPRPEVAQEECLLTATIDVDDKDLSIAYGSSEVVRPVNERKNLQREAAGSVGA